MTENPAKTEYDPRPIGVFDSGFGGASTLRNMLRLLPDERFIYFGDNANAPYGDRPEEQILALSEAAADMLLHRGVKALVVACNTATSASIKALRRKLAVPVVSVEPAIKPACEAGGDGIVLMLATAATVKLARYRALRARMPDPDRVKDVGCSGLVELIERGLIDYDSVAPVLAQKLAQYEGAKVDGIVLGCTHYPFIAPAVKRWAEAHFTGPCRIYDGNEGTARQLARVLVQNGLSAPGGGSGERVTFLTSGDEKTARPIFERLLEVPVYEFK